MVNIQHISIPPSYIRDGGLSVLSLESDNIFFSASESSDYFKVAERSIVHIPPKQIGGNHKHPRVELFIALQEGITLYWKDNLGRVHTEPLQIYDGQYHGYIVLSYIPHAVINTHSTQSAYMIEFANESQHDVEPVEIITEEILHTLFQ